MNLRHQLARVRRSLLSALYRRTVPLGNCGPIVSFAFDDFPRTAFLVGGAILEKFGVRGTYYVTVGLANASTELGDLFVQEDLDRLREKGHEIGSQTFHHSSCRVVSLDVFRSDVCDGVKAVENFVGRSSVNFAYPYGHVTLRSKRTIGPCLSSSRSVIPGLNGPDVDLNLLRANSLYGDDGKCPQVEELIQRNSTQKAWLIFYTHDVRPNPSAYGCTPDLFKFAVSRAVQSGSRILTVAETLNEIGVPNEPGTGVRLV
jgi:peptidoglycan/xylan/chitin deacetylase (PgdA/CDA1 family)